MGGAVFGIGFLCALLYVLGFVVVLVCMFGLFGISVSCIFVSLQTNSTEEKSYELLFCSD